MNASRRACPRVHSCPRVHTRPRRGAARVVQLWSVTVCAAVTLLAAIGPLAGLSSARAAAPSQLPRRPLQPVPQDGPTALVEQYLAALERAHYDAAFALLNAREQQYYRDADNFGSVYVADRYRVVAVHVLGMRSDAHVGRVYFVRETARFRDHARDADLTVTATVPVGVIRDQNRWAIKDPGHPWRAFASRASTIAGGVRLRVKKISFFARRIEAVVSVANESPSFITFLPYGRSLLRDSAGHVYRPIVTRDWSLTDKAFFEGLRLAPNAQYTGMLAFTCVPLSNERRTFALTFAPVLAAGADVPFSIVVPAIAESDEPAGSAR